MMSYDPRSSAPILKSAIHKWSLLLGAGCLILSRMVGSQTFAAGVSFGLLVVCFLPWLVALRRGFFKKRFPEKGKWMITVAVLQWLSLIVFPIVPLGFWLWSKRTPESDNMAALGVSIGVVVFGLIAVYAAYAMATVAFVIQLWRDQWHKKLTGVTIAYLFLLFVVFIWTMTPQEARMSFRNPTHKATAYSTMSSGVKLGSGEHALVLQVNNRERRYIVHVPQSYDEKRPIPVVIMFHGGGGTAKNAIEETGWTAKADQAGFLAVFPEGSAPDPSQPGDFRTNPQTWNDGSKRFYPEKVGIDDGAFTRALIDELKVRFTVDARRVFLTGFSNGSSLTYRLGVELSDCVAAIAPVGSSGLRLADPQVLQGPVSMISLHGLDDKLNPFEGGAVKILARDEIDPRPPITESVERWAKMLACPRLPEIIFNANGVKALRYGPGTKGSEIIFYTIEDTGHTWPGGNSSLPEWIVGKTTKKINATDVIWDFFAKHPMPK
jgi:polyhydroxybutyrate depolymerase